MKTILNYNDFVNESLNKEDFYKGKQYKVKVLKCDNKQSWYCDSIDEEITVVDDPNPKQWEDGKERWKVIPNGNLHGVNYILKDDCSEPINESLDYEISDIEEVFESNGMYTQKEILGYNRGLDAPEQNLFKVDMMVTPNMTYGSQEELNNAMGRITEIKPDKITYKRGDGKLYTSSPDDLIIVDGINESLDYEISDIEEVFESKLQDDYREFFKHVLDLYEVKSPASIKDEKCKKEFFNKIQKGWVKGQGLSEYGKKLMDCECLDDNGEFCDNEE